MWQAIPRYISVCSTCGTLSGRVEDVEALLTLLSNSLGRPDRGCGADPLVLGILLELSQANSDLLRHFEGFVLTCCFGFDGSLLLPGILSGILVFRRRGYPSLLVYFRIPCQREQDILLSPKNTP